MASAVLSLCLICPATRLRARHHGPHRRHARPTRTRCHPARHRRQGRRRRLAGSGAAHHVHAAGSALTASRPPNGPRCGCCSSATHRLCRRDLLRRRSVEDHRVAVAARRVARPRPTRSSWCSTPSTTTRTRSCSAPTRSASSTTARWRAKGRRAACRFGARHRGGTQRGGISAFNPNWDGDWVVKRADHRARLGSRDGDPAQDAALRDRRRTRPGASTSCATSATRTSRSISRRSRAASTSTASRWPRS